MVSKLNSKGEYLPFYGYTVLSMVEGNFEPVEAFIKRSSSLNKHVAGLPAESFHVTLYNIFTHRNVPQKYLPKSGVVPLDKWLDMDQLYPDMSAAQKACDRLKGHITMRKGKFFLGNLPGQPLIFEVNLSNEDEISKLRAECAEIFQKPDPLKFHVTLGYIFKEIDKQMAEEINKELALLWELLKEEYTLYKPSVYFFKSMEEFIPFNTIRGFE